MGVLSPPSCSERVSSVPSFLTFTLCHPPPAPPLIRGGVGPRLAALQSRSPFFTLSPSAFKVNVVH
jgi:hypothetical protein